LIALPPLQVYHSHGKQDPIVPALMGNILQERVLKPNTNVTFFPFSGTLFISNRQMAQAVEVKFHRSAYNSASSDGGFDEPPH